MVKGCSKGFKNSLIPLVVVAKQVFQSKSNFLNNPHFKLDNGQQIMSEQHLNHGKSSRLV